MRRKWLEYGLGYNVYVHYICMYMLGYKAERISVTDKLMGLMLSDVSAFIQFIKVYPSLDGTF